VEINAPRHPQPERVMQDAYPAHRPDGAAEDAYSFDVIGLGVLWPLVTERGWFSPRPRGHRDPAHSSGSSPRQRVTTMHFVRTMLQAFLATSTAGASVPAPACSAAAKRFPADAVNRFFDALPDVELHNLYGPTEASVDVTAWRCTPGMTTVRSADRIANMRTYVLDEPAAMPLGVPGEPVPGRRRLARGYRNRPDDTARVFVDDPFRRRPAVRPGDLARLLPVRDIEFSGRIDASVKVRATRRTGRVAAAMRRTGRMDAVAAVVDGRLVGYLIPTPIRRAAGDRVGPAGIHATAVSCRSTRCRHAEAAGRPTRAARPVSGPSLTGHVPVGAVERLMAESGRGAGRRAGGARTTLRPRGDSVTAIRIVAAQGSGRLTTPQCCSRAHRPRLAALSSSSADTTTTQWSRIRRARPPHEPVAATAAAGVDLRQAWSHVCCRCHGDRPRRHARGRGRGRWTTTDLAHELCTERRRCPSRSSTRWA